MIEFAEPEMGKVRVKVVGVGNAGGNIVRRISRERLPGVECGAINTAIKDLGNCPEIRSLQIGGGLTRGHGAGMDPAVGRKAALEDANKIRDFVGQCDVLFLVAGFGKGTGTGATPAIGEMAREAGTLTVALVTTPFSFEKRRHHEVAEEGLNEIRDRVDAFVPLSNQRLFGMPAMAAVEDAFAFMDEAVLQAVRGIVDVLIRGGRMSLDLADMRTLLKGAGQAAFAVGSGKGETRVVDIIKGLKEYPFLDDGRLGSPRDLLVSLIGGRDLLSREIEEITSSVASMADGDPKMTLGMQIDETMQGEIRAMVLAAGQVQPSAPATQDFDLFGDALLRGVPGLYRPAQFSKGRGPGAEREQVPAGKDDSEYPSYLRKGKGLQFPGARG